MRFHRGAAALVAVGVAAGCASAVHSTQPVSFAGETCGASQLTVTKSPEEVGGATGEHAVLISIRNVSTSSCTLVGYPTVSLRAANGTALPFTYRDGDSQHVTSHKPTRALLRVGGRAWFLIAKYRCDSGETTSARTAQIRLPGVTRTWRTSATEHPGASGLAVCTGAGGRVDPADPGNTVHVSPIEPTRTATAL